MDNLRQEEIVCRQKGRGLMRSNRAQMALVFLVVILVGLFFLGVTANWNRMAASRTQTTIASNMGATNLASYLASYTQAIIKNELGGSRSKCRPTEGWEGFWAFFGLEDWKYGSSADISGMSSAGEMASMGALLSSTAVQGVGISPGTSLVWSILLPEKTLIEDRITESIVGAALPLVVADPVMVKDEHVFNMNGTPDDPISRFAFLYSRRVWNLPEEGKDAMSCKQFEELQKALKELAKTLGLKETECEGSSAGNPCCVPKEYRSPQQCEEDPQQQNSCSQLISYSTNPFREWPYDDGYCEGKKEDTLLNFIGVDDGNRYYKMKEPNTIGSVQERETGDIWRGHDSTGKTLSLLWELRDSYMDMRTRIGPGGPTERYCHWYDRTELGEPPCDRKDLYLKESELVPAEPVRLKGCRNWRRLCNVARPDNYGRIDGVRSVEPFLAEPDPGGCPQDPGRDFYGLSTGELNNCPQKINSASACDLKQLKAVWRRGWDADGSRWPHWNDLGNVNQSAACLAGATMEDDIEPFKDPSSSEEGLQCSPVTDGRLFDEPCGCDQVANNKDIWRTDSWDDAAVRLRQMIREMAGVMSIKCKKVNRTEVWQQAVQWVTYLKKIRCDILAWRKIFELWTKDSFLGEDNTWCLPPSKPPDMPQSEYDAIMEAAEKTDEFNPCGSSGWGNLESVTACMDWNADESKLAKFGECKANCDQVIPDLSMCSKNPDGSRANGCGKCRWQSCRVSYWWDAKGKRHDKMKRVWMPGNCGRNPEVDANFGPNPDACHDLPRSFYAHNYPGTYTSKTMEEYFEEDSCCAQKRLVPSFANRTYYYGGELRTHPDCEDVATCNMVERVYTKREEDWEGVFDPEGRQMKQHQRNLVEVSYLFRDMTVQRFSKRAEYLRNVREKIEEILPSFEEMADKITSAVDAFEPKVKDLCEQIKKSAPPKEVYYVWRNRPQGEKSNPTWHAVKIEVAIPGRCGDKGKCLSERIPWLTSTIGQGKRCKTLTNSRGIGWVKVWRYDEERTPISVIKDNPSSQAASPLAVCGSDADGHGRGTQSYNDTKNAFVSCATCSPFPGRLENHSDCAAAVKSVIEKKAHSVKTEMEYWVTKDPNYSNRYRANLKIRQKP